MNLVPHYGPLTPPTNPITVADDGSFKPLSLSTPVLRSRKERKESGGAVAAGGGPSAPTVANTEIRSRLFASDNEGSVSVPSLNRNTNSFPGAKGRGAAAAQVGTFRHSADQLRQPVVGPITMTSTGGTSTHSSNSSNISNNSSHSNRSNSNSNSNSSNISNNRSNSNSSNSNTSSNNSNKSSNNSNNSNKSSNNSNISNKSNSDSGSNGDSSSGRGAAVLSAASEALSISQEKRLPAADESLPVSAALALTGMTISSLLTELLLVLLLVRLLQQQQPIAAATPTRQAAATPKPLGSPVRYAPAVLWGPQGALQNGGAYTLGGPPVPLPNVSSVPYSWGGPHPTQRRAL
ncbi:hypothetical protein ACSSS7_001621 [Eimeria intestinalis]